MKLRDTTTPKKTSTGTIGKAWLVIEALAAFERPVRFFELLKVCPFPRATLYRILQNLVAQKLIVFTSENTEYSLGTRFIRVAHFAWKNASLASISRPMLQHLAEKVGETVHLAQIDNGQVFFVDKIIVSTHFETLAQIGQVAPAYCTGVGKAILAYLPAQQLTIALQQQSYFKYTIFTHTCSKSLQKELAHIRTEGIAYDREEHQQGIISIAAPIVNNKNIIVGAISIATATTRHSLDSLMHFKDALCTTAKHIGLEASFWHFAQ